MQEKLVGSEESYSGFMPKCVRLEFASIFPEGYNEKYLEGSHFALMLRSLSRAMSFLLTCA